MTNYIPSKYQNSVYNWIKQNNGSAIIDAVAGSGKTSTIVEAIHLVPSGTKSIFLAFNTNIANELKTRVPVAATFHSVGFRALKKIYPNCELDDRKILRITRKHLGYFDMNQYGMAVKQLVDIGKQRGIGVLVKDEPDSWLAIIDHFDIPLPEFVDINKIVTKAREILQESNKEVEIAIDYNDMLYIPLLELMPIEQYDFVFIDEAQDTNNVRRKLAESMLKRSGRLVAVGDPHQAIYGFTGADSDAMNQISSTFKCETLPLSICYRCGKAIVTKAKQYVPQIEFWDESAPGIVGITDFRTTVPTNEDVILCRNTAPLVMLAYKLISNGIGCRILGREIGNGLKKLCEQMKKTTIDDLYIELSKYKMEQTRKYLLNDEEEKAQNLTDRIECLQTIIQNLNSGSYTIPGLYCQIDKLFNDTEGKLLTLSTIHKAKGLEWNRVFIYKPELMPSSYARKDWQMQQEINLEYVATTRARKELYYVTE